MLQCTHARQETAARPPVRAIFFAPRGPRPHAKHAPKNSLQRPPERPLLQPAMLKGWSTGGTAAASKWNRLPDLQGGAQTGVPRPLAHTQRGGLGGGWRPFCTHPEVGIDVLRDQQACATLKKGPPSPARGASQSERKSTLRAAGGKRERWAVDWGGWGCQKGPRCQDRAGLGSCQWSGPR